MVETSDEWITSRTGIKERRIARADEFTSHMGAAAALVAIENAGLTVSEIDFILVATLSPDYLFPSTACLIQQMIGAKGIPCLDIQAACTGYLYALSLAKSLIASKSSGLTLEIFKTFTEIPLWAKFLAAIMAL